MINSGGLDSEQLPSPFDLGFSMPAEWANHEATWLAWPKNPLTFSNSVIARVEQTYVEMIDALSKGERIELLVDDDRTEERVASMLSSKRNVRFQRIPTADVWIRDYGPIFVKNHEEIVAATKWKFNAWGEKYDDLLADNKSGRRVCEAAEVRIFEPSMVLEGGSIDVNGAGSCLTTRQCLLNKNRNPQMTQDQIESRIRDFLGGTNLIWLDHGISGDDTDGHIDDIARFVKESTVLCMITDVSDVSDNYLSLKRNYEILKRSKDQEGEPLNVEPLSMPKKLEVGGDKLPASYANFYIGNSAVLVPTFGDRNDDMALTKISDFFPQREIVGINCTHLVQGFGAIHCVTQQQPIGENSK
jgi:agmatine deiminase